MWLRYKPNKSHQFEGKNVFNNKFGEIIQNQEKAIAYEIVFGVLNFKCLGLKLKKNLSYHGAGRMNQSKALYEQPVYL